MVAALVLAFREGLEAALILGIVMGVLRGIGRRDQQKTAWLGAGLAALLSLSAGIGLYALGISFEGRAEQVFEGLAILLAAGVLTWMIFWMDKQGRQIQDGCNGMYARQLWVAARGPSFPWPSWPCCAKGSRWPCSGPRLGSLAPWGVHNDIIPNELQVHNHAYRGADHHR